MSTVISPTLTTIDQPGFEIGQRAASILIDELAEIKANRAITYQNIEIPTSIIERESTLRNYRI
jgi:LacI family transcriptional regulator